MMGSIENFDPRISKAPVDDIEVYQTIIEHLLKEDRTFRDAVHGDIIANHLETRVIDTQAFQRLRMIKQLGTAHLVYHSAEHSRFQHSLGTLFMADQLLKHIGSNRFSQYTSFNITEGTTPDSTTNDRMKQDFFILMTRLSALLHDITVVPFSHTLEKEGKMFKMQWEDEDVLEYVIGEKGEIYKEVKDAALDIIDSPERSSISSISAIRKDEISTKFANTVMNYLISIMKPARDDTADGRRRNDSAQRFAEKHYSNHVDDLMHPKLVQVASGIVSDTVCADLLDYVKRDFFFCGIRKTYDERFLKYACIYPQGGSKGAGQPVFAYRLLNKRHELKNSVLSSLLDVIDLRYSVAELVHVHTAKNSFSAMVIESFNLYWQNIDDTGRREVIRDIVKLGDDELLDYLLNKSKKLDDQDLANGISNLITRYKARKKYLPLTYTDDLRLMRFDGFKNCFYKPSDRAAIEIRLSNYSNLNKADVLLYAVPQPESLHKALDVYVVYNYNRNNDEFETEKVSEIGKGNSSTGSDYNGVESQIQSRTQELQQKFNRLWRTYIFLSENAWPKRTEIKSNLSYILSEFGVENPPYGQASAEVVQMISKIKVSGTARNLKLADLPLTLQ